MAGSVTRGRWGPVASPLSAQSPPMSSPSPSRLTSPRHPIPINLSRHNLDGDGERYRGVAAPAVRAMPENHWW